MELEAILKQLYPDPNGNQIKCLKSIVSLMGYILINSSNTLKIKKVILAGSLGKNTILKGHLEVDCVYILEHSNFSYYHSFLEVQRVLKANLPEVKQFVTKKHSITFKLNKPIGVVSVDLLPAFEINDQSQMTQVRNRDAYYGSTSLIQKKYFKKVIKDYSRFRDLVLLLKSWRNTHKIPLTSYMLELIVSNAIYDTQKDQDFSFFLEVCFRTIQSFTDGRVIAPVYWSKSFDDSDYKRGYSRSDLWLIDPSDLSDNMAKNISPEDKYLIHSEAVKGLTKIHNGNYVFLIN